MSTTDYRDKRFLIVDSLKPSRDVLKKFAFNLEPEVVEASGYANDIVLRCSENHYDVLLLGYDLGESQKNGQQLLEELRTNGLINRQSIVILITAENSQSMVLAALEHKPDDYLTKPYRIKDLLDRLDRCYKKKRRMEPIYKALDNKSPSAAIQLCDEAIKNNTPYVHECYGIKSRQLFEQDKLREAADIYYRFETERNCQWATIGLGKIALKKEKYPEAISYFANLIDRHPLYLSSYDWLATTYENIEQYIKAQEVLEEAIKLSPLSVKRLERYAKLCLDNGDFAKATKAFDQNYQLSCNSIHHKPENAFNFSHALNQLASDLSDYQLKLKKNRVVNALSETNKTFNQLGVKLQSHLHTVRLMLKTHDEYDARRLLGSTETLIEKVSDELDSKALVGLSKLLVELDRKGTANELIAQLVEKDPDNVQAIIELDSICDDSLRKEDQAVAQNAISLAIKHFRAQDYGKSLSGLKAAMQLYPNHIGIKLNTIQVLLALYKESGKQQRLGEASKLLSSLVGLPTSHTGYHRYKLLEKQYNSLK
ncbi:response regulator [Thalassotalea euphylliae]|uniref:response regulator n=1 Tax=Thalassotalea euphylliae TaxID=1655234 RepID=UPI00363B69AD